MKRLIFSKLSLYFPTSPIDHNRRDQKTLDIDRSVIKRPQFVSRFKKITKLNELFFLMHISTRYCQTSPKLQAFFQCNEVYHLKQCFKDKVSFLIYLKNKFDLFTFPIIVFSLNQTTNNRLHPARTHAHTFSSYTKTLKDTMTEKWNSKE